MAATRSYGWSTAALDHEVSIRYDSNRKTIHLISAWLESDEAHGVYTRSVRDDFPHTDVTIWFSDPNTAFAFKMRFG